MAMNSEAVLAQIDDALAFCGASASDPNPTRLTRNPALLATAHAGSRPNAVAMSTTILATIERIAPNSAYSMSAASVTASSSMATPATVTNLTGVLVALRAAIEAGYLLTLQELVHATVFSDFLEMADELQRRGFKDAAGVIAGTVLEEHVRKLAAANEVETQDNEGKALKLERLNTLLARVRVYNGLEQKNVTAWYDLRNKAAHGEYEAYDHSQVAGMIQGVRDFAIRHPA
ncbi:MAG TPA: hypothetical protein VGM91_12495 [Conexibacter sp.]|jgi:hypothetical protein